MPYCPLWSGLMLNKDNIDRLSNCYVETHFNNLKLNILNGEKNLRASRFLRKIRSYVLAIHKELALNIRNERQTRRIIDADDERISQETWNKRQKAISSHFTGRFLKKNKDVIAQHPTVQNSALEDDVFDIEYCLYCGGGRLNETADWVQYNQCQGWVHQICESEESKSYKWFVCLPYMYSSRFPFRKIVLLIMINQEI